MNYFIGVSKKDYSNFDIGRESFWCIQGKSGAKIGDILFIYVKSKGIKQLFKIIQKPEVIGELNCEFRNMLTVKTELLYKFENPISYSELNSDSVLQTSGFVRRKFQGTTFHCNELEAKRIIEKLKDRNKDSLINIF